MSAPNQSAKTTPLLLLLLQTVQLTRREKVVLDEKVQEIAATVNEERDLQLQQAMTQVSQLEMAVAVKEEVR